MHVNSLKYSRVVISILNPLFPTQAKQLNLVPEFPWVVDP